MLVYILHTDVEESSDLEFIVDKDDDESKVGQILPFTDMHLPETATFKMNTKYSNTITIEIVYPHEQ